MKKLVYHMFHSDIIMYNMYVDLWPPPQEKKQKHKLHACTLQAISTNVCEAKLSLVPLVVKTKSLVKVCQQ